MTDLKKHTITDRARGVLRANWRDPLTPEERARRRAAKAARPVTKRTEATTPRPKPRRIVVTVYPAGTLGLRPERCRREELLDIGAAYCIAVKTRVLAERNAKRKEKS